MAFSFSEVALFAIFYSNIQKNHTIDFSGDVNKPWKQNNSPKTSLKNLLPTILNIFLLDCGKL